MSPRFQGELPKGVTDWRNPTPPPVVRDRSSHPPKPPKFEQPTPETRPRPNDKINQTLIKVDEKAVDRVKAADAKVAAQKKKAPSEESA